MISRGLDLCESTLCSDVAHVKTWVMSELSRQQTMVLRMMDAIMMLGQKFDRTRCAHRVEEGVVEGVGAVSGGHGSSVTNASAVEGDGTGSALGMPFFLKLFRLFKDSALALNQFRPDTTA